MGDTKRKTTLSTFNLLMTVVLSVFSIIPVFAHGGVDDEKPAATPVSDHKGMVTQTARAGELEILLKHSPLEPDTETAAKLFVTRFATNEPFPDAKPSIQITAKDGKTFEASEVKSDAPGSFSFKLPPLPEGSYTILARLNAAGKTDTATFSSVSVEHAEAASAVGSWVRTVLMILTGVVVLGLFGGLMFYAFRFVQGEQAGQEAVSV
ncbi:MAG: hypothetical protein M3033_07370 [Acidobacteriota bacterium]|nr:hypothetical protein [Acidobacteriota bacterium]